MFCYADIWNFEKRGFRTRAVVTSNASKVAGIFYELLYGQSGYVAQIELSELHFSKTYNIYVFMPSSIKEFFA